METKQSADNMFDRPLEARDVAQAAVYMLSQSDHISIKALDIVLTGNRYMLSSWLPSLLTLMFLAQRSLNVFDRSWNERN